MTPQEVRPVMRCHPVYSPPHRLRTTCDERYRWLSLVVGLGGLEPPTSSLSGIEGSALCGPAFSQVAAERQGRRDAFLATLVQAAQASQAVVHARSGTAAVRMSPHHRSVLDHRVPTAIGHAHGPCPVRRALSSASPLQRSSPGQLECLRRAAINSSLRIDERPGICSVRARSRSS